MGLYNVISSLICAATEIKEAFYGKSTRKLNIDYYQLPTKSVLFILTTAVSRASLHDSGDNYSSCGLISSDSRSLN